MTREDVMRIYEAQKTVRQLKAQLGQKGLLQGLRLCREIRKIKKEIYDEYQIILE